MDPRDLLESAPARRRFVANKGPNDDRLLPRRCTQCRRWTRDHFRFCFDCRAAGWAESERRTREMIGEGAYAMLQNMRRMRR